MPGVQEEYAECLSRGVPHYRWLDIKFETPSFVSKPIRPPGLIDRPIGFRSGWRARMTDFSGAGVTNKRRSSSAPVSVHVRFMT